MKIEDKISWVERVTIMLFWLVVITMPILFMDEVRQNWRAVHVVWSEAIVVGVLFLINRFVLLRYLFFNKRYTGYVLSLGLIFCATAVAVMHFDVVQHLISMFNDEVPISPFVHDLYNDLSAAYDLPPLELHSAHRPPSSRGASAVPPDVSVLIMAAIVVALDMGLAVMTKWFIAQQRESQSERAEITAQLSRLQSQVSPHFFMNTLNNIHALVDIDSQRAKQTIIEFSELMDYLLYECSNHNFVPLQREIEFVQGYTNLMRLRYSERVEITMGCEGVIPSVKIPPLLFLNFIENAFKYGVDNEKSSYIKILFRFSEWSIDMTIQNSNHQHSAKSKRHGLGIANARRRLELIYGDRYSLTIADREASYYVNLKMPIKYD